MARLADGEVEERLRRVLSLLSRSRWGLSEAEIARETGWGPQRLPLKSESVLTGNQPEEAHVDQQPLFKIGDFCPECGQASVVNDEGCRNCYSCGNSEC